MVPRSFLLFQTLLFSKVSRNRKTTKSLELMTFRGISPVSRHFCAHLEKDECQGPPNDLRVHFSRVHFSRLALRLIQQAVLKCLGTGKQKNPFWSKKGHPLARGLGRRFRCLDSLSLVNFHFRRWAQELTRKFFSSILLLNFQQFISMLFNLKAILPTVAASNYWGTWIHPHSTWS